MVFGGISCACECVIIDNVVKEPKVKGIVHAALPKAPPPTPWSSPYNNRVVPMDANKSRMEALLKIKDEEYKRRSVSMEALLKIKDEEYKRRSVSVSAVTA